LGENSFELGSGFKRRALMLGALMAVLQCIPLLFIWARKRRDATGKLSAKQA
jgi:hypothetical protein